MADVMCFNSHLKHNEGLKITLVQKRQNEFRTLTNTHSLQTCAERSRVSPARVTCPSARLSRGIRNNKQADELEAILCPHAAVTALTWTQTPRGFRKLLNRFTLFWLNLCAAVPAVGKKLPVPAKQLGHILNRVVSCSHGQSASSLHIRITSY